MANQEPARLGDYVLLEKLGQGGMAQVYRGERTGEAGFRKRVALKRMLPQYKRNPALLERFAAEARTNARLDHPNLVAVVDFGIEPEPYLVMEFVDGVPLGTLLDQLVKKNEKLEIAAALFIGAEAASGLDHAHRKRDEVGNPLGIVHRDVSPQNVLLSNEGAVKVSDFGLVKAADNVVQTGSGIPIGKMSYMAPEQASHLEVDARADVFSLGIVVWEMLAMRVLIPSNDPAKASQMLMTCDFPPPSHYRPEIPPELDAIVAACLVKDPTVRTPSAQALGMSLREQLHEIAPGYGRDQLARLLGWVFPERGWSLDEPYVPAAQPSAAERLSIPQVASAGPVERTSHVPEVADHAKTHVDVQMANPLITGPRPPVVAAALPQKSAKKNSPLLWILVFGGLGAVALAFLVGMLALLYVSMDASDEAPASAPMIPEGPSSSPPMAPVRDRITITTDVEGAWLFRGGTRVGALPQDVLLDELERESHVVIAPRHDPEIVDAFGVRERGTRQIDIYLEPSRSPERAALIRYPRRATARVAGRDVVLGPVPGVVLLPTQRGRRVSMIEIVERGRVTARMSTHTCSALSVCVLEGGVL